MRAVLCAPASYTGITRSDRLPLLAERLLKPRVKVQCHARCTPINILRCAYFPGKRSDSEEERNFREFSSSRYYARMSRLECREWPPWLRADTMLRRALGAHASLELPTKPTLSSSMPMNPHSLSRVCGETMLLSNVAGLEATHHGTGRSPAGKIVQVEVQRGSGVPTADIFSPPCLHHLSSSLGFLVVLDAPSRRLGSFLLPVPAAQTVRSDSDPKCADPFDNTTVPITDCKQEPDLEHLPGVRPTMCRKIRQKVSGVWRYFRSCAYMGEPGIDGDERFCLMRTGTYNIFMEYCTCNSKDGCNTASYNHGSILASIIALAISLRYGNRVFRPEIRLPLGSITQKPIIPLINFLLIF
ncbi:hypothetical protein WN48_01822 [Eufriesea mexicana]|nr:hypothetical protein WN48_01822 [Eufriesea mexicana]